MALIALEGMSFHSFHGVYETEQINGAEFIVDVIVRTNIAKAADTDDVATTINYETVYHICQMEMQKPRHLLESVVMSIIGQMKQQFAEMHGVRVRVRKMNPPLNGKVAESWVEEELDFLK